MFSCEFCKISKNNFSYRLPLVAASAACNFIKKEIPAKIFFCEFGKISKNIFWQSTSGWLLLKFICEFWEVFQNISFIEHLWETAYFMYKLQYFNQQIQWRTISQVLFKHFIQELEKQPTCKFTKKSFTYLPSCILPSFSKNASRLLLPKRLWNCEQNYQNFLIVCVLISGSM